jgi:hypothetical protein
MDRETVPAPPVHKDIAKQLELPLLKQFLDFV